MLEILSPSRLYEALTALYGTGMPPGDSTGWATVDEFYTVAPGQWTVVTGVPSHGKSTWIDNLMINLMRQGWRFVIYSPENQPVESHLANLCEKYLMQPFRQGYHNRMEPSDMAEAMDFFEDHLIVLRFDGGAIYPSLNTFLMTCDEVLTTWDEGKIGVILDPWNETDHIPNPGMSETNMINWELMRFRQWIRAHSDRVHGWIVAHPTKPTKDKNGDYKDVSVYDISGSASFKNKCDVGIVVRRREGNLTQIEIEKCRWKHIGKQGSVILNFNHGLGMYSETLKRDIRNESGDEF